MKPTSVKLLRTETDSYVAAVLREMTASDLTRFEQTWQPILSADRSAKDRDWNWTNKYIEHGTPNYERYAIDQGGELQGLMIIETHSHRSRKKKFPLVYVEYLASAPWNRRRDRGQPKYRLVGSLLLHRATVRSAELGYEYRLGLHSLPDKDTEDFYRNRGMTDFGKDKREGYLRYFEFDEIVGRRFATTFGSRRAIQ